MSNDPYPNERPDPYTTDPYSSDPFVPGDESTDQLPAYEPGRSAPLPPPAAPAPAQLPAPMPPGAPGMPPPYPYAPAQAAPVNTSAIVLVIFSSLALVTGYCCYIGIPGLILGILGITKNATDPEGAAKLTKIGWITFAALSVITFLAIAVIVIGLVAAES